MRSQARDLADEPCPLARRDDDRAASAQPQREDGHAVPTVAGATQPPTVDQGT